MKGAPFRPGTRSGATFRLEKQAWADGMDMVAGIDEVGRGPLAGPVVAAAVVWPRAFRAPWLRHVGDSKTLSAIQRDYLYARIVTSVAAYAVAIVDPLRIDEINILNAAREAMTEALAGLSCTPELVLLDALTLPEVSAPQVGVIGGDRLSYSVAAASIVAKVTRDSLMAQASGHWPVYGFERHVGYATRQHVQALIDQGPCPLHRRSFAPVRLAEAGLLTWDRYGAGAR